MVIIVGDSIIASWADFLCIFRGLGLKYFLRMGSDSSAASWSQCDLKESQFMVGLSEQYDVSRRHSATSACNTCFFLLSRGQVDRSSDIRKNSCTLIQDACVGHRGIRHSRRLHVSPKPMSDLALTLSPLIFPTRSGAFPRPNLRISALGAVAHGRYWESQGERGDRANIHANAWFSIAVQSPFLIRNTSNGSCLSIHQIIASFAFNL